MTEVRVAVPDEAAAWVQAHPQEAADAVARAAAAAAARDAWTSEQRAAFRERSRELHERPWTADDEAQRTAVQSRWRRMILAAA